MGHGQPFDAVGKNCDIVAIRITFNKARALINNIDEPFRLNLFFALGSYIKVSRASPLVKRSRQRAPVRNQGFLGDDFVRELARVANQEIEIIAGAFDKD